MNHKSMELFDNRALRHILSNKSFKFATKLGEAHIHYFNITHKDIARELPRLMKLEFSAQEWTQIKQAETDCSYIYLLKNTKLRHLLFHAPGKIFFNLTDVEINQLNLFADQDVSALLARLSLTVAAKDLSAIYHENFFLRLAQQFDSPIFCHAIEKFSDLKTVIFSEKNQAKITQAIVNINTVMSQDVFDRPLLERLLVESGLGYAWLEQPLAAQDIIFFDKPNMVGKTWWDLLQVEHLRIKNAYTFLNPLLRQKISKNFYFIILQSDAVATINKMSPKISRGALNTQLHALVPGMVVDADEFLELRKFTEQLASTAQFSALKNHRDAIQQMLVELAKAAVSLPILSEAVQANQKVKLLDVAPYLVDSALHEMSILVKKLYAARKMLGNIQQIILPLFEIIQQNLSKSLQTILSIAAQANIGISNIVDFKDNLALQVALIQTRVVKQLFYVDNLTVIMCKLVQKNSLHNLEKFTQQFVELDLQAQEILTGNNSLPSAPEQLYQKLEILQWQFPAGNADEINLEFNFLSSDEIATVLNFRLKLALLLENLTERMVEKSASEEPAQIDYAMIAQLPSAKVKLLNANSLFAQVLQQQASDNSQWLEKKAVTDEYVCYSQKHGLSLILDDDGLSYYDSSLDSIPSASEDYEQAQEFCTAWAQLLLPLITTQPVIIGGHDMRMKQMIADELQQRNIDVFFEDVSSSGSMRAPEKSVYKKGNFFAALKNLKSR